MANPYQYQYGGFPSYQNTYQPPQMAYQQSIPQPQVQNTSILYVDGDKGAEEFQMLPNTFAFLKATDGKAIYFKQSLANGTITCEKYVLGEMRTSSSSVDYVTREEFEEFVKSIKSVKENNYESVTKSTKSNAKSSKLQTADAESGDN